MWRSIVSIFGLILLTAVVYEPVRSFGFIDLDDPYYVVNNAELHTLHGGAAFHYAMTSVVGGNWNPLVWASFFFDRWAFDLKPGPMHVENALLHAASAVVLLQILVDGTNKLGRATVVSAVFACHPIHVESVAWISERKDVLSTLPLLLSIWCYLRHVRTGRWTWYAAVVACFVLSLSAKAMGVTLPAVLLLVDIWPLGRVRIWNKLPLCLISSAACVVAMKSQSAVGATGFADLSTGHRAANAAAAYGGYLHSMAWPTDLCAFYPLSDRPAWIVSAIVLFICTTAAVVSIRSRPFVFVGWMWFVGALVPVIGLVQVGYQARADRYAYFPSIGLSIAVVWLVAEIFGGRKRLIAAGVSTAVVSIYTMVARTQVADWSDSHRLFQRAADVTEGNYFAERELGRLALGRGDVDDAGRHLERAVRYGPSYAPAWDDYGSYWTAVGRPDRAAAAFDRAVRISASVVYRNHLDAALRSTGGRLR